MVDDSFVIISRLSETFHFYDNESLHIFLKDECIHKGVSDDSIVSRNAYYH